MNRRDREAARARALAALAELDGAPVDREAEVKVPVQEIIVKKRTLRTKVADRAKALEASLVAIDTMQTADIKASIDRMVYEEAAEIKPEAFAALLIGAKGYRSPPHVALTIPEKARPRKHEAGALVAGQSVWYREERYWIAKAPKTWEETCYVHITDVPVRPGAPLDLKSTHFAVHADLVEPAPVRGKAYMPQPTKQKLETEQRMKESGLRDIGDQVAEALRGKDLEQAYKIAAKWLGAGVNELKSKYGHLNPGQQRMNLGNRMRRAKK
jgi:hypothetical protein